MSLKFILPLVFALVMLAVWACLALLSPGEQGMPGPSATAHALWDNRAPIFAALGVDVAAMVLGFLLATALGVMSAIALSGYKGLRLALEPWLVIGRMAPITALAPLAIISPFPPFLTLFIVTTASCFFPVVSVATPAICNTPKPLVDLFSTYRATYWQEIFLLRLPHALPQLMTAIKRAAIYAPVAALLTDYLAGLLANKPGLGVLLGEFYAAGNNAGVAALCLAAAAVGIVLAGTVHAIALWTLMHWHDNENGRA